MRTILRRACLFVALGSACKGDVGLTVTLPSGVGEKALWIEVGAFKDGHCDGLLPMLGNGVPAGATVRLAFKKDEGGPKLGNLPNGKYAIAAAARSQDCTVLATGCNDEDIGSASNVTVNTEKPDGDARGTCPAGASCQAASCVPANDNGDPSVGAGCSLELLGSGPLAKPIANTSEGTQMSAPAIAVTSTGFIIAYREIGPNGDGGARITLLPIDNAGGAGTPERPPLPSPCSTNDQQDGVGLIVNNDNALMTLTKPPCGAKPELQLLNFKAVPDEGGQLQVGKFYVSASPNGDRVSFGAAKSAAFVGGQYLAAFNENGEGRVAHIDPTKGIVGPNGSFGATTGVTDTWLVGNNAIMALLAASGGTAAPLLPDGGVDTSAPAGGGTSTMNLLLLPANTPTDSISAETNTPPTTATFPGAWASMAALAGRVVVVSDGGGVQPVTYRVFDQGPKQDPSDTNGFGLGPDQTVTHADVALVGDRAYFAAIAAGEIGLKVYANATTHLTPLRDVLFSQLSRISAIKTVSSGRVAVAATDKRVAVAWTTAKVLQKNDGSGGYAVFACSQ